jgi:hypothetical protein
MYLEIHAGFFADRHFMARLDIGFFEATSQGSVGDLVPVCLVDDDSFGVECRAHLPGRRDHRRIHVASSPTDGEGDGNGAKNASAFDITLARSNALAPDVTVSACQLPPQNPAGSNECGRTTPILLRSHADRPPPSQRGRDAVACGNSQAVLPMTGRTRTPQRGQLVDRRLRTAAKRAR